MSARNYGTVNTQGRRAFDVSSAISHFGRDFFIIAILSFIVLIALYTLGLYMTSAYYNHSSDHPGTKAGIIAGYTILGVGMIAIICVNIFYYGERFKQEDRWITALATVSYLPQLQQEVQDGILNLTSSRNINLNPSSSFGVTANRNFVVSGRDENLLNNLRENYSQGGNADSRAGDMQNFLGSQAYANNGAQILPGALQPEAYSMLAENKQDNPGTFIHPNDINAVNSQQLALPSNEEAEYGGEELPPGVISSG